MSRKDTKRLVAKRLENEIRKIERNRAYRRRIEEGPFGSVKGKDAIMVHLLMMGLDALERRTGSSINSLSDGVMLNLKDLKKVVMDVQSRVKTLETALRAKVSRDDTDREEMLRSLRDRIERCENSIAKMIETSSASTTRAVKAAESSLLEPMRTIGRDVSDSYKISSRTNLLMTELSRKLNDISGDLGAMEDSLRLEVADALKGEMGGSPGEPEKVLEKLREHDAGLKQISRSVSGLKSKVDDLSAAAKKIAGDRKLLLERLDALGSSVNELAKGMAGSLSQKDLKRWTKETHAAIAEIKAMVEGYGPLLAGMDTAIKTVKESASRQKRKHTSR